MARARLGSSSGQGSPHAQGADFFENDPILDYPCDFDDQLPDNSVLISEKDDHFKKCINEEEKTGILNELEHAATDFKNKAIA